MQHLGSRVSALLDGQLGAEEEERAWAHVHACRACRELVEHEGWIKTRLLGLALEDEYAPSALKGALTSPLSTPGADPVLGTGPGAVAGVGPESQWWGSGAPRRRGMVALGGGALGAAFLGVLALTVPPSSTSGLERRPPVTSLSGVRTPAAQSTSVATPAAYRIGTHHGRAGVSGVKMDP